MELILEAKKISKSFPGVQAVDDVSLALVRGEILALVGENGAGKSTLTQILGGVQKPDSGEIVLEGVPVTFQSSDQAIHAGISMVFQELSLVGSISVAENIFANRHPVGIINNIHWRQLYQNTRDFLDRFDLNLNPKALVKHLSMGTRQILEILKAISTNPKVLILDEPTSSLTERETIHLFDNIHKLRKEGMSFIYITHKLSEVFQIADRVMVMRDGKYIDCRKTSEVTESDLISLMVGRKIEKLYGTRSAEQAPTDIILQVEGFTRGTVFQGISFELRKDEILGFAGLIGAGRTEVGRAIAGVDRKDAGRLFIFGKEIRIDSPADAIRHHIAYLTEDRKGDGLFLNMTLRDNMIAPAIDQFTSPIGMIDRKNIDLHVDRKVKDFSIATTSIAKKVLYLSGGTQQKVLVAMWTGIKPKVILFDEPTRGVDVGSKAEIYQILRSFTAEGTGVIMISSDLPELIGMCDRILVFHHGRITGELLREDFSEERILSLAAGITNGLRRESLAPSQWALMKEASQDVLARLAEQTTRDVHVAVLQEGEAVYIARSASSAGEKPEAGDSGARRVPAYCTAAGKVLLAGSSPAVVQEASRKLKRFTRRTITQPERLKAQLQEISGKGFAAEFDEFVAGEASLAVPVRGQDKRVIAALGFAGNREDFDPSRCEEYRRLAMKAAQEISSRFEELATKFDPMNRVKHA